ncbi:MAG: eukaryotic-like serine/threonine-protein kinase [Pyrinomonadaceae bacterium]|jgi:serine/threonine protein kinase/cytochrome c-type biogenesis protein CcmH/NrfG|nr:eukaryotic-like serine/threonine-protein kinase [Pyrinomonadaceae bacterium]
MIGQTISHYRILDLIGEGGMGVVYEAEDTRLGRRVAIKIPSAAPDSHNHHARFLREARSISALSHARIATLFDYGETPDGRPFIVMELVNGRELGDLMRAGELSIARAIEIIADVAEALSEAHRHGIIHRDIKPSNVIINERGEVKVLDFGLAKLITEDAELDQNAVTLAGVKTRSDVMLGTPLYLSPEQAKAAPVDGRSDIFSLGALLYESVTGRPAFSGATVVEIAAQVIHVTPPPPSELNRLVPGELDRITLKALAKRPEERYQKAEDMIADLRALSFHFSELDDTRTPSMTSYSSGSYRTNAHRATSLTTLSDNLRRPRLSIAAVLVGVVALAAVVWGASWLFRTRPHEPPEAAKSAYDLGTNSLREGAYYQASTRLEQATSLDDKFVLAHARLAEAYTELDDDDRAAQSMLRIASHDEESEALSQVDALRLEAIRATVTRDYPRAVNAYQQITRELPDSADAYVDLGRAYEKTEQVKQAFDSYVEATNRDPEKAVAYLRIGILSTRGSNPAGAISAFDKAEQFYKKYASTEGQTEVLYRRGYLSRTRGNLDEARAQLQQALDMARAGGNLSQRINTLLQLSAVATNKNDPVGAQNYATEAVEHARAEGKENLVALSLIDLGNTFFGNGEYAEAEKYLQQGLIYARRGKVSRYAAKALGNIGSLRIQQGKTEEGIRYVQEALAFYQAGGYRKEEAQTLALLGRGKRQKGNYEEALSAFEQVLRLAEQAADFSLAAATRSEIGNMLLQQDKYAEALQQFEESYKIDKSLNNELNSGYGLYSRGEALWPLGRYDEARSMFEQALLIAEKPGGSNKELLAFIYLAQANMALSQRNLAEAKTKSEQALAAAGEQNKTTSVEARRVLGWARALSGERAAGIATCREALTGAQEIGDPWLISNAQLALAEALLEGGDAAGARSAAQEAQTSFARFGQKVSEWRAWLVAARAVGRTGDVATARGYATRAASLLEELQQKWGTQVFNVYQARPDVQVGRKHLGELSANAR